MSFVLFTSMANVLPTPIAGSKTALLFLDSLNIPITEQLPVLNVPHVVGIEAWAAGIRGTFGTSSTVVKSPSNARAISRIEDGNLRCIMLSQSRRKTAYSSLGLKAFVKLGN